MTWLRWDTDSPFSDVVGDLAEALDVQPAQAFGHYVACCLGFGQHRRDGMVSAVSDRNLEIWALWRGRAGRFAAAFRARCTADGSGRDTAGSVRGWWRQRALLDKQRRDALKRKPAQDQRETREGPPPKPPGYATAAATLLTERNDTAAGKSTSSCARPLLSYHSRCVVALNAGLQANPLIGSSRHEIASTEMAGDVTWERDGIPVEIAERVVRDRAASYRPRDRSPQPRSLAYFDAPVREAWEIAAHPTGSVERSRTPLDQEKTVAPDKKSRRLPESA